MTVVSVENLSKSYRLGQIGTGTLSRDLNVWWAKARGKPNPLLKIGQKDDGNRDGETIWALKDVSFEVKQGEVLGIIGRNGAGKSTLLKILSQVTAPTDGRIRVKGRVASLLEVGTGFHPELTGRENVFLNGAILGMSRAEVKRKLDEIVAFSEVEQFLETPVKRYSSGMYVRLAFAVAAHLDPEILLVDEVLAVGDAAFQKKCLGKMEDVAKGGRTVLFVSHNMAAVTNLCHRALLLDGGRVVCDGQVSEVTSRYIATGVEQGGEKVWADRETAPGSDRIRLHAVRIVSKGEVTADVDIDQDVHVEIEYWNLRPGSNVAVSVHLLDGLGAPVLATGTASERRPAGLFRAVCTLPGNFLNNGRYSINAIVLTDVTRFEAQVNSVLSFTVHDTGVTRGEYLGVIIGVVRPTLPWKTEYRGSLDSLAPTERVSNQ